VLNSFQGHACPACEEHISLVTPCAGNPFRNGEIDRDLVNQDAVRKIARSVKKLTVAEMNAVAVVSPQLSAVYTTGAQWVSLHLQVDANAALDYPEDHLVTDTVPWLILATKGTKPVAQYLAGLHGLHFNKRSKPQIIQDLLWNNNLGIVWT
jgi:hypothetical protein